MIGVARLSLRLLRLGGRRAALSAGLVGAGVAVGTMLLALALGGVHGWDARDERTGWRTDLAQREPAGSPVALAATRAEVVAGRSTEIVDLAGTVPGQAPPPGLVHVPAPGEVLVSPALADLLAQRPVDGLVPTGTIADAGLRGPDELVAVVGVPTDAPDLVPLAGFGPTGDFGIIEVYRQLTYVAAALLVFPVASLLGASARLTAARRTERLALLRLLGASTRQVTVAAVTEVVAVAAAAAALGVALYWLAAPAVAWIELGGGRWFADDVRPAPPTLLAVVAGVALLAAGAAVGGMRQVVVGPLGVVRRQGAGGVRLLRLLGVVAGLVAFGIVNTVRDAGPANITGLVFGIGVLILFGTVSLVGPLVVRLLGAGMVRSARSAGTLLAGRRLLDDPKGAFRPLAGLTLAVFVAGFLAPLTSSLGGEATGADLVLAQDLQRGTLVVLVGTFVIAATATGTTAAARILDHRRPLRLLRLAGTPLAVLDAARRAETVRPLLVLGGIGLAMGLVCASPFAVASDAFAPSGLLLLGVVVVLGVLLVAGASAASRPLLRSVTTESARED
ncbi:FtsX-like permease family protein [Pseudonocardia abyssalis]|uniref:ABC3 transporter permease C-terminal domain-containing protein n=1 Tax=Pseudonocardia abyssalis TaxID=2792008 RepID=A0ABS6V0N2_9PSEU|nr:FtsX-like permease family protein [Pseudonocardia abyssalis]MBW0137786.1 hypothetical protein [Pseudonocardia abyssalis]